MWMQPSCIMPQITEALQRKLPCGRKYSCKKFCIATIVVNVAIALGPAAGTCQKQKHHNAYIIYIIRLDSPKDQSQTPPLSNQFSISPPGDARPSKQCIHQTEQCRPSNQQLEHRQHWHTMQIQAWLTCNNFYKALATLQPGWNSNMTPLASFINVLPHQPLGRARQHPQGFTAHMPTCQDQVCLILHNWD